MAKLSEIDLLKFGHTIQLVGAVYAGEGRAYLAIFPEEQEHALPPTESLEMSVGEWERFLTQTDLLETEVTARAADGTVKKAIVRKSSRQIEAAVTWRVYKRDGYRCRYCGKDDVPLTIDHVVCWEEGGPSIEQNLVASCKKCNRVRGNTPFADWLKHDFYVGASKGLPAAAVGENDALALRLDAIPRMSHVRSR